MNPDFLDLLKEVLKVNSNEALSRALGFSKNYIKNLRPTKTGKAPAKFEIAVQERTNWGLWEMREKMKEPT